MRQELLLGVGGRRALTALGIQPGVLHLNEGHSALAVLEAIRWRMETEALSFDEAARRVARLTVFTTHTPAPAGHERRSYPILACSPMYDLYERHLSREWQQRSSEPKLWNGIETFEDGELWETHQILKTRLIDFVRRRVVRQLERAGESAERIDQARRSLNPNTLTIGFARRFASYKRAALLLRNLDRLANLVNDPQKPIQLIFAGKAHPNDQPGKLLLQEIARLLCHPRFAGRVQFVEDYTLADIWFRAWTSG
jgi:glucan phosphorylase